jgi:hypothetical protein
MSLLLSVIVQNDWYASDVIFILHLMWRAIQFEDSHMLKIEERVTFRVKSLHLDKSTKGYGLYLFIRVHLHCQVNDLIAKSISPVFRSALSKCNVSTLDHLGDFTERPKVNVVRRDWQVLIHTRAAVNAAVGKVLRIDRLRRRNLFYRNKAIDGKEMKSAAISTSTDWT